MKRIILCLSLFAFFGSQAQQINPVPDYVFSNKMSVGRNAVTDTAAYFSIGPRYGAIRGMMPPMVTDTASMSATKRNGLLIFSIQKNKYLYWDSVGSKWAEMAGTTGSALTSGDTASMLSPYIRHAGNGLTKSGQSLLVDTAAIATRARVQKAVDSINGNVALKVNISDTASMLTPYPRGTGVGNYMTEWVNSRRLDTANMYYANGRFAIGSTTTTNGVFNVIGGTTYLEGNLSFGAADRTISNISNNLLAFATNNTERMRLKADGELLINSTTDVGAFVLQVGGSQYVSSAIVAGSTVSSANRLYVNGDLTAASWINNAITVGYSATNNYGWIIAGGASSQVPLSLSNGSEVWINTTTDAGSYSLQVAGAIYNTTTITTGAPTGGSIKPWRLGEAATVSPTSPNRTIRVEIDGTVYYIHAKTTND